jgi:predicted glycoside hydrolase/deacetylase ChbG (UPF0249 family)
MGSKTLNFLAWLLEDVNDISAEVGSPRDAQLQEFEKQGFLEHYDCHHDTNFYAITSAWMEDTSGMRD